MKFAKIAILALASAGLSQAAVTVSGTGGTGVKRADGVQVATGSLAIWIADTNGDGFGSLVNQSIESGATLNVGDLFGGDTIVFRTSTTQFGTAPNNGRVLAGWNYDNPAAAGGAPDLAPGTSFAIVWFSNASSDVAASTTQTADGMFYGVARFNNTLANGGWITGTQTSGSVGFTTGTPSAANPFKQLVAANFTNNDGAAGQILNNASAEFQVAAVIPEPSAALLGAIGALGLLRRRRI